MIQTWIVKRPIIFDLGILLLDVILIKLSIYLSTHEHIHKHNINKCNKIIH